MTTTREREGAARIDVTESVPEKRRLATVFDAVAGRIGANGFSSKGDHQFEHIKPSRPEDILLRRLGAPQEIPFDFYSADEKTAAQGLLPDSDLLKDVHEYVSNFYESMSGADFDFRSLDESALLAIGILLEEMSKEALGENGDMVFSEPQSTDQGLPESRLTRYQVIGKVMPRVVQEYHSTSDEEEPEPAEAVNRSRKRRRYQREDE